MTLRLSGVATKAYRLTERLEKLMDELNSARRNLLFETLIWLVVSLFLSQFIRLGFAWVQGKQIDVDAVVVSIGLAFAVAWLGLFIRTWKLLPSNHLYGLYKPLHSKEQHLRGLIDSRLFGAMKDLEQDLHVLGGSGLPWRQAERFQTASGLISGLDDVQTYFATSTDSPCSTLDLSKLFHRLSAAKLKGADVRRLLVYPSKNLFDELKTPENRQRLQEFIGLHERQGSEQLQYQLRYWPKKNEDLLKQMEWKLAVPENDFAKVLVDMAVVNGNLLFGQALKERDAAVAAGQAYIKTGVEAAAYKGCFDYLWNSLKHECFSAAQLVLYLKLIEMRQAYQRDTKRSSKKGEVYFRETVRKIEESQVLMAIDVAPDPVIWWNNQAYRDFQIASIKAAKDHGGKPGAYHGRIFVVPGNLDEFTRSSFIKEVIQRQYDAGIELCLYHRDDLIDKNLAAVDCIFSSDWGFYLGPGEGLDESLIEGLKDEDNTINKNLVDAYLKGLFDQLKKNAPQKFHKRANGDPLDEARLRRFLIEGPI